jgi:succinate dehydrogenase/fumarate reductase-like Fe-S protein
LATKKALSSVINTGTFYFFPRASNRAQPTVMDYADLMRRARLKTQNMPKGNFSLEIILKCYKVTPETLFNQDRFKSGAWDV